MARSTWRRAWWRSLPSIRWAAPVSRRLARWAMATTISRSRSSLAAGVPSGPAGGFCSTCRCAFKNICGSARIRSRTAGDAARQAAYNWPASRLL